MAANLEGRRILVIGASAGIGQEIGLAASERGGDVVFSARRKDRLDEAVAKTKRGYAVRGDVTVPADCVRIVKEAVDHLGGLDLVVFSAGWAPLARLNQLSLDDWQHALAVNLFGAHLVIRAVVPHLAAGGMIGLISSEVVKTPYPGLVGYSSTKAALEHLIRGWRLETPGVRIACVRVGQTYPTEFGAGFDGDLVMELFPDWVHHGLAQEEFMAPPDIAGAIVDLLGAVLPFPGIGLESVDLRSPSAITTNPNLMAEAFERSRL